MRKTIIGASAALALLLLTGCSSGSDNPSPSQSASASETPSATPTATQNAEDVAAMDSIKVTGEAGKAPKVEVATPFNVTQATAVVDTPGTGAALTDGDLISMNYVILSGQDGSSQYSTWDSGTPERALYADTSLPEVLLGALKDQKVGVRVKYAIPDSTGTDTGTDTATPTPTTDPTSTVMILEVSDQVPGRAEGTAVTPAAGLPTVTLKDTGEPELTKADGDAPKDLVVQPLIQGSGAKVAAGDSVTVQYSGWLWDGTAFDSSWSRGQAFTTTLNKDSLIEGWVEGLAGQTVGSQVMLVIPPSLAYGDEAKSNIPAGSTLVFVIDILASAPAPAATQEPEPTATATGGADTTPTATATE